MKESVVVVELERLFLSFQARGQHNIITTVVPPSSVWSPSQCLALGFAPSEVCSSWKQ